MVKIASINEGYEYVNQEGETVKVDGLAIDKATAKERGISLEQIYS